MKNGYIKALKELEWQTDFKKVEALLKPAIKINKKTSIGGSKLGLSRFGGTPDLPLGMDWPTFAGNSLIFLAQINLEEIKMYDIDNELPDKGIIYFFIHSDKPDAEEQVVSDNKKRYRVLYSENNELKNIDFPKEFTSEYHFKPVRMEFQSFYTFPSGETLEIESLEEEDRDNSYIFNDEYGNHEGEQVLGYTMPIQCDVTHNWAFSYLDFKTHKLNEADNAKIDAIRPEFVTLLQVSMENFYIGFDRIVTAIGYFGITKDDLKNKNFDKAILVFQDT